MITQAEPIGASFFRAFLAPDDIPLRWLSPSSSFARDFRITSDFSGQQDEKVARVVMDWHAQHPRNKPCE